MKKLFANQQNKSNAEYNNGFIWTMVFDKTMKQRVRSYKKRQGNHNPLKKPVVNDIDAE